MRAIVSIVLLAFLTSVLIPSTSYAVKLSLTQALEMSIKTSEDVQIKTNEVEKTARRIREEWSRAYPDFSGHINYNYYPSVYKVSVDPAELGMPSGGQSISFSTQEKFELAIGLTLNQLIYSFGRVKNGVEAAKNGKRATELAKGVTEKEIAYNAALVYLSVLVAQESVKITEDSYSNSKKNLEILEGRFSQGRIPKGDYIKMKADIAGRLPGLKKAQSSLDLTKRALKFFCGIDEQTDIELTDSFITEVPEYDRELFLNKMIETEPALRALRMNVKLYKNLESLMKAEHLPEINAFASYDYFGSSDKAYIGDRFQHLATLGLSLRIPIWNGGKTYAAYQQSSIDRKNAQLELQKAKRGLTLELENSLNELKSLSDTYKANLESQKLSEQSYLATIDRFKSGEQTAAELNDGERWFTQTKADSVTTVYEINKLIAKIEKLTAGSGDKSWRKRLGYQ